MLTRRGLARRRYAVGSAVLSALAATLVVAQPALAADPTDGRALGLAPNSLGPRATQLGDVDGDGRADVFSYRAQDQAWLVSYSGTSAWTTVAHGAIDPSTTWLADMNADGKVDVFSFRASDHAWLVSYSANSNWQVINHAYLDPSVTRFGDTTGDGKADVFTRLTNGQWVRSNAGTGAWEVINGGGFLPTTTWVGDINGDGKDDVVAIDANYGWRVSYGGSSAWQTVNNGYLDPAWTQLVDIDGDGQSDIFTINSSGQWVVSYSGIGAWQVLNGGGLDPSRTWLADLDGDGDADLFTIQGLTRWMVSYSTSTAWSEINNGYLPVDSPADSAEECDYVNGDNFVGPNPGLPFDQYQAASEAEDNACFVYSTPERPLDEVAGDANVGTGTEADDDQRGCTECPNSPSKDIAFLGAMSGPRTAAPWGGMPWASAPPSGIMGAILTGTMGTAVLSLAQAAVAAAARSVPWPDPNSKTAKKHKFTQYKVYEIYAVRDEVHAFRVFKYGITRQIGATRPESQLPACNTYFSTLDQRPRTCKYIWITQKVVGYWNARAIEAMYATKYKAKYGKCPPGMPRCL